MASQLRPNLLSHPTNTVVQRKLRSIHVILSILPSLTDTPHLTSSLFIWNDPSRCQSQLLLRQNALAPARTLPNDLQSNRRLTRNVCLQHWTNIWNHRWYFLALHGIEDVLSTSPILGPLAQPIDKIHVLYSRRVKVASYARVIRQNRLLVWFVRLYFELLLTFNSPRRSKAIHSWRCLSRKEWQTLPALCATGIASSKPWCICQSSSTGCFWIMIRRNVSRRIPSIVLLATYGTSRLHTIPKEITWGGISSSLTNPSRWVSSLRKICLNPANRNLRCMGVCGR